MGGQHYLQLVNIEGLRSEEVHMQSIKLDPNFLEAWAHLTQFHQDLANSEKALECLQQVLQVDGSEEFNSGFGSHMPLILGQAKGVHYFPNYERTLDVAKAVIREKMHVYSKGDTFIYLRMENCKR